MGGQLIMGVDPGFDRVGVAVINGERGKEKLLYSSCIITSRRDSHEKRLYAISKEIRKIINGLKPEVLAIEKLFFNLNKTNAIKVAEGRGAILSLAGEFGIDVFEYSPQEIKLGITGYGKASKNDIEFIIGKTMDLDIKKEKRLDDEFDAIAVAVTHSLRKGSIHYPHK